MKKFILAILILISMSVCAYADRKVIFNGYDPISVCGFVTTVDYADYKTNPEATADVKTTIIYIVTIREKTADGTQGETYSKKWDLRANNPDGLPQFPTTCLNSNRKDCDKWLYQQTALEYINVNTHPEL